MSDITPKLVWVGRHVLLPYKHFCVYKLNVWMDFLQCFSFSIRNGNYSRRNNGDGKVTSLDISENRVRKPSRCLLLFRGHFYCTSSIIRFIRIIKILFDIHQCHSSSLIRLNCAYLVDFHCLPYPPCTRICMYAPA